jgi:type VI secretion system activator RovC-like protein
LRILDAKEAGAGPKDIGDLLLPDIPRDYPENSRSKALVNNRKAAQKLRDGGYRSLLDLE